MTLETDKSAGDEIDSRCLKCKDVTNHIIIAMTGDTIAKVECNTCGARHKYRPPVAEKKKVAAVKRRRDGIVTESRSATPKAKSTPKAVKKVSRKTVDFGALVQNKDISSAISYSMDALLASGDLVQHPIFGLGVVMAIKPPNKAEVAFQEHGTKLMICKLA